MISFGAMLWNILSITSAGVPHFLWNATMYRSGGLRKQIASRAPDRRVQKPLDDRLPQHRHFIEQLILNFHGQ